jgi:hypothetical protein
LPAGVPSISTRAPGGVLAILTMPVPCPCTANSASARSSAVGPSVSLRQARQNTLCATIALPPAPYSQPVSLISSVWALVSWCTSTITNSVLSALSLATAPSAHPWSVSTKQSTSLASTLASLAPTATS